MESLTAYLSNISLAPTYDGLENPMSRLIKDLTDGVYTSEEAAIERIINSQDKVALLNYFPGRFKKLIHFAASQGYNNLIKFILLQTIDSGYNMSDYLNSLDSNLQTPLRLARQNGHTETSNLLMSYGSIELYPPLRVRCKKCENCFVVPSNVIEECTSSHRAVPHVCNKCKTKRTKHKIGSKKTKIQINKKKKQKVNNGRNVVVTKVQRVILPVQKKKPISYTKK